MADNYVSRKVFHVLRFLEHSTDENHGVTGAEIIAHLNEDGLKMERKTVYTDVALLRDLGYDILLIKANRRSEYRLIGRVFDTPELKMLADSVASSRFITSKKSHELIAKLATLTSDAHAQNLARMVAVENRIKSMDESIFTLVDTIHEAINLDEQLTFQYFTTGPDRKRILRHDGAAYLVSPLSLMLSEGNYYLYAWDHQSQSVRTYRVDRMTSLERNGEPREIPEELEDFNAVVQTNESFSMYSGQLTNVTLKFNNSLAHVVFDRFGQNVMLIPQGDDSFTVRVDVMISPTFLGWLFGFGSDVKILDPPNVVEEYTRALTDTAALYSPDARS